MKKVSAVVLSIAMLVIMTPHLAPAIQFAEDEQSTAADNAYPESEAGYSVVFPEPEAGHSATPPEPEAEYSATHPEAESGYSAAFPESEVEYSTARPEPEAWYNAALPTGEDESTPAASYTVAFLLPGGYLYGDGTDKFTIQVSAGDRVPPACIPVLPAATGDIFVGWKVTSDGSALILSFEQISNQAVTSDTEYTAVFEKKQDGSSPPNENTQAPGQAKAKPGISPAATLAADTWETLSAAITDASDGDTILLTADITRDLDSATAAQVAASANDLPQIDKTLTIDGDGHTLSFLPRGVNTVINRPGFRLAMNAVAVFTLKNINFIRSNATTYSLIGTSTNAAGTTWTEHNAAAGAAGTGASAGWIVNLEKVNSTPPAQAPTSGLVSAPSGSVNFMDKNTWLPSGNYRCVNAASVTLAEDAALDATGSYIIYSERGGLTIGTGAALTSTRSIIAVYASGDINIYAHAKLEVSGATSLGVYQMGDNAAVSASNFRHVINVGRGAVFSVTSGAMAVRTRGIAFAEDSTGHFYSTTVSTDAGTGAAVGIDAGASGGGGSQTASYNPAANQYLTLAPGSDVTSYSRYNAAILMCMGLSENKVNKCDIIVDNATLYAYGHGAGEGTRGATVSMVGGFAENPNVGGSGYTIINGGVFLVESLSGQPVAEGGLSSTTRGQPAVIQEVPRGMFKVEGEGSKMILKSYGYSNEYGATIRFRESADVGPVFQVSNKGEITIDKYSTATGSTGVPAVVRFGYYTDNAEFNIESGGRLTIRNNTEGVFASNIDNNGIDFQSPGWKFNISGENSAIEILSKKGPAVTGAGADGSITVSPGAIFVASGTSGDQAHGIFNVGNNFQFSSTSPQFYDFENHRPGGALIFSGGDAANNFTVTDSDVSLWRNGNDYSGAATGAQADRLHTPVDGNPFQSWTRISYNVNGASFGTFGSSSDAPASNPFTTSPASFGARGMAIYTRVNGNNAGPIITDLVPLTNADKYVRALGVIPEGLDREGHPIYTDEAMARFQVTHTDNSAEELHATESAISEDVWEQEIWQESPKYEGVIKYSKGGFLLSGDKYKVLSAWRGEVDDPDSNLSHLSSPSNITAVEREVEDVSPPKPLTVVSPDATYIKEAGADIVGMYGAQDAWNPEPPAAIYAMLVPAGQTAGTTITDTAKSGPDKTVYATMIGDEDSGAWTYTLPSGTALSSGDRIYFIGKDANGNANPITSTPYHDAIFMAAPYVTVAQGQESFTKEIVGAASDGALTTSDPATDITYRLLAVLPGAADMARITKLEIVDDLQDGLVPKDGDIANVSVLAD
ncbi:MAG: hypothetical protein LBT52_00595, partial [Clostridiales Family XIII bacterium]|nr:hypothetical protein [Clostridiales Family XIII bacterium]